MSASVAVEVCLQCGKSRNEVKDPSDSPCATAEISENGWEGLEEWERHHWRNWSDSELAGSGILPEFFELYRRMNVYGLMYVACAHTTRGHSVCVNEDLEWGMEVGQCWLCGRTGLPMPQSDSLSSEPTD